MRQGPPGHAVDCSFDESRIELRKRRVITGEPFGLYATPVYSGGLRSKWLGVAHKLEDERVQLALCDGDRERCVSEAALKFRFVA